MKKYILIPALLLLAAACNKTMDNPGKPQEKGAPISFTSNAQGGTKVTLDGLNLKWAADDKIAVYSYKGAETTPTGKDLCDLSSGAGESSGSFTPETETFGTDWVKDGVAEDVYTFYSWYPASAAPTGSSETVANVAAAQSEGHLGEYLICWDQANETKTRAQVITGITPSFSYSPRVALLKVAFHNTTSDAVPIDKIHVATDAGSIAGNVTLNVMNGSISGGTSASIEYTLASSIEIPAGSTSAVQTIALLPNEGTITVRASTSAGGAFTFSSNTLASAVAAGCCYTVTADITEYEPITLPTDSEMASGAVYYGEANCVVMANGSTEATLDVSLYDAGDNHARGTISASHRSAASKARVIWYEAGDDNSGLILNEPTLTNVNEVWTMTLTASKNKGGNALVGLYDSSDKLLWSFHVWAPKDALPPGHSSNGLNGMALALGQVTGVTDTYMYYQWGRKDPLGRAPNYDSETPSSFFSMTAGVSPYGAVPAPDNTAAGQKTVNDARSNPTVFYTYGGDWTSRDDNLWKEDSKTIYDPCPKGYRIAPKALWADMPTTWKFTNPLRYIYNSLTYTSGGTRSYTSGSVRNVGTYGYYWSGSVAGTYGKNLNFDSDYVYPEGMNDRAYGRAVRCVGN